MSLKVTMFAVAALLASAGAANPPEEADPTCSDLLGIDVHGQHIVGDYVSGIGHGDLEWAPSGGVVGEAVSTRRGVAVRGGPGPGFHFEYGFAPGASFCNDSNSPGLHP